MSIKISWNATFNGSLNIDPSEKNQWFLVTTLNLYLLFDMHAWSEIKSVSSQNQNNIITSSLIWIPIYSMMNDSWGAHAFRLSIGRASNGSQGKMSDSSGTWAHPMQVWSGFGPVSNTACNSFNKNNVDHFFQWNIWPFYFTRGIF